MSKGSVLVIEDEALVRDMILEVLRGDGYEVVGAADGMTGFRRVQEAPPDLVVLDLNLPEKMRGLDICRQIRSDPAVSGTAVLVLTGNKEEQFEAALFDAGADEYIRKNDFKPHLFLRRVAAVLRRASASTSNVIQNGPLTIHPARREVMLETEPINLTPTEFDILYKLASNPDRAHSRRELLDRGAEGEDATVDRTVDVHILSIRRKLQKYSWLISTVWGVGYRLGSSPSG